jgi:hypothetical protein
MNNEEEPVKYCLDANVFVQAHRLYYAFDIAPSFWSVLIEWGHSQVICSPRAVYDELAGNDDLLGRWCKNDGAALFREPDEQTYDRFRVIADLVQARYQPQLVQPFLAGADPWVIAYAAANSLTVVTMESLRQESPDPKTGKIGGKKIQIPNVCQQLQVSAINTFDLLRQLNFRFR